MSILGISKIYKKKLIKNIFQSNSLKFLNNHGIKYPTPANLNYFFSFGFLAAMTLFIQIITGLLLTMYFTPNTLFAFFSVDRIMRDVYFG
jgi:quinol-cytochrome oxidoreductase complex cytochrome b subunit